jgi:hypothetical protein
MVTMRSSSSEVSSPALQLGISTRAMACEEVRFGGAIPLVEVNIGLLADQVGVTTTNTLDLGQGEHDLLLAINLLRMR